jgi:hypothetical protein
MSDGWSLALLSVLAGDIILWPRICRSSRAHRHQGCVCAHGDVIVRCCAAHIPAIPLPPSHSSSLGSPSGPVPCGRERASPPALLRETVAAAAAARLSRSRRAPPYADKLLRAAPYGTREKAARPATAAVRSSSSGRGRQCHWGTSGQKLSTPFGLLITSSDTTWHVAAAHGHASRLWLHVLCCGCSWLWPAAATIATLPRCCAGGRGRAAAAEVRRRLRWLRQRASGQCLPHTACSRAS